VQHLEERRREVRSRLLTSGDDCRRSFLQRHVWLLHFRIQDSRNGLIRPARIQPLTHRALEVESAVSEALTGVAP
jgi:hypothetical protein